MKDLGKTLAKRVGKRVGIDSHALGPLAVRIIVEKLPPITEDNAAEIEEAFVRFVKEIEAI